MLDRGGRKGGDKGAVSYGDVLSFITMEAPFGLEHGQRLKML